MCVDGLLQGVLRAPRIRFGLGVWLIAALTVSGCGEPGPNWVALEGLEDVELPAANLTPGSGEHDLEVHQELLPEAWQATPIPGVRMTALAVEGHAGTDPTLIPHVLTPADSTSGTRFENLPWRPSLMAAGSFAPGQFTVFAGDLFLFDPDGSLTRERLLYTGFLGRTEAARFRLGRTTADGWLLRPGERAKVTLPNMEGAVDLFLGLHAYGSEHIGGPTRARVLLDGDEVFATDLTARHDVELEDLRIPLELDGEHTLELVNQSGHAILAARTPRVVQRTWNEAQSAAPERPDVVLFIADTFRADLLAVSGGDPALTPRMNLWADGGRAFTHARATSPWTLPSHTTMFTGLYPFQHGVTSHRQRISDGLVTLAERMHAAGYRTVGITDGLYVSETYGLDQGFESFYEHDLGMAFEDTTLPSIEAALAGDDGRPLFLFVQTYNVHTPYQVSPKTRAAFPELFDPAVSGEHWIWPRFQLRIDAARAAGMDADDPEYRELAAELRSMYLGNVHDFDAHFQAVLDAFDAAGTGDPLFVLTSDHGEAFLEHGYLFHSHSTYEEEVHVPLVLHGPGIAPGVETAPASLIDLAPTIAALADINGAPDWVGRSLLAPAGPSTPFAAFATDNDGETGTSTFALYSGSRKVIGDTLADEQRGEPRLAFDLAADPLELEPAPANEPPVGFAAFADVMRELLTPVSETLDLELSELQLLALDAMGYVEQAVKELEESDARLEGDAEDTATELPGSGD